MGNSWSASPAASGIGDLAERSLAAVLGQVAKQSIHLRKVGAIDQVASLRLDAHQAGMRKFLEMEGQRITRHAELVSQNAGQQSWSACHNERTESPQSLGMGKSA